MSFRSARENAGYSQQDIARMLDVDGTTPGKWELGINKPRVATLVKLAGICGCSIEQLLDGNPTYPPTE